MILNMNGGSAGGGKSAIIVTAPAGSTVTCSMGDAVKTAVEKDGTWTFRGLDNGTWTVTAALGAESSSRDVIITRLTVEYVTLEYKTYLIQNGISVNEDVSGGWKGEGKRINSNDTGYTAAPDVAQNDGYILITEEQNRRGAYRSNSPVDLTDVSTVVLEGYLKQTKADYEYQCVFGCYATSDYYKADYAAASIDASGDNSIQGIHTVDVSALSGSYYLMFGLSSTTCEIRIDNLYLQ